MCGCARLYQCVRCHCQVIICRHCDRGNVYCADQCAELSRLEKQGQASARYQASVKGRHANARRQQRFRQRQREKVTHQGSAKLGPYDLLVTGLKTLKKRFKKQFFQETSGYSCHFCGCQCSDQLRIVFLP